MIFKNTTVLDVETTGLNPSSDAIIEVALIRIREGKIIGKLSYLINPEILIPENITELTGISNNDVKFCPTIKQIFPWIMSILGDSLLVAHNALFDLNFFEVTNQSLRGKSIKNNFIDTRAICIDMFPYESHKLDIMCKKFGIPVNGAHQAFNDVSVTWELLQKLNEKTDIEKYVNKLYYFKKYGKPNWNPEYAEIIGL
ncbi:3'-5' exonuclease [Brevibacillus sp. SYSU BS000544]|uniref:3'-5' exonuclease n=1 Tax=Brevibacillus sp. SYSU BS000544 TaxID=3416443 RepID=UPI003CE4CFA1